MKTSKKVTGICLVVAAFPLLRVAAGWEDIPGGLVSLTLLSLAVLLLASYLAYTTFRPLKKN